MEPVRLGIIGCGVIGPTHMKPAMESPDIELVAVADRIEERANAAQAKFGAKKVYREGDDLIDDPDIEAVVLALPTHGRLSLALHAFAQGKHVLAEKPVAMSADDVRRMIAARGDLTAGCCSGRYRFHAASAKIAQWIAEGNLGTLRLVRCRAVVPPTREPAGEPPEWRLKKHLNGGGILMNWGCYDLDCLLGLLGWKLAPETVLAQTWTVPPAFGAYAAPKSDAETHIVATVRFHDGVVLNYERAEFIAAPDDNAWEILGTEGSVRFDMRGGQSKPVTVTRALPGAPPVTETLWDGGVDTSVVHTGPTTDFCAAIREGRPPMTSLEQALVVQRITDAIYRSAETGEGVEV